MINIVLKLEIDKCIPCNLCTVKRQLCARIGLFQSILFTCVFLCSCRSPNKIFHTSEDIQQLPLDAYIEALQGDPNHYLIDVRTPFEHRSQHLEGATNISFIGFKFGKEIDKLDRDKTVFIYCETAHRSPYAAKRLKKMGFTRIIDLAGGYRTYRKLVE